MIKGLCVWIERQFLAFIKALDGLNDVFEDENPNYKDYHPLD